jgi:hypothetical protein
MATGIATGGAGVLAFGWLFLIVPSVLIVGALVQPRAPRSGKLLMWVGAGIVSIVIVPVGFEVLRESNNIARLVKDPKTVAISLLFIMSTALVISCDVALAVNAVRNRNRGVPLLRREIIWPVWAVAIVLTLWATWSAKFAMHALRINGRSDVFLTWLSLSLIVFAFDIAIVVLAIRRSR